MTITLHHGYKGPTDHSGGNSAANNWAAASASGAAMAEHAAVGDTISYDDAEYVGEQVWSEFRKAIEDKGLFVTDNFGDGYIVFEKSDRC